MFFAQFRPRSALKKMCRMHFCKFLTPPPSIHLQNVIFILLNPFLIPAIDLIISSEVSQIILFGGPIWGPYDNVNFNVFEKTSEKYDICTHLTCTRLISQWAPKQGPQIIQFQSTICQLSQEQKTKGVPILDQFLGIVMQHSWKPLFLYINLQFSKKKASG